MSISIRSAKDDDRTSELATARGVGTVPARNFKWVKLYTRAPLIISHRQSNRLEDLDRIFFTRAIDNIFFLTVG